MTPPSRLVRICILQPLSWAFVVTRAVVAILPDRAAKWAIAAIFWPALAVGFAQRRQNLERLFSSTLTRRERRQLARRCARHYRHIVLDTIRLPSLTPAQLIDRVRFVGEEHLSGGLARGQGVILIGHHLGNVRVALAYLGVRGFAPSVVAYEVPVPSIARHQQQIWHRFAVQATALGNGAAATAQRTLTRGGIFVTFSDICLRPERERWLPIGNAEIKVDCGPERLVNTTDAVVLLLDTHREDDGRYTITVQPEPEPQGSDHPTGGRAQVWVDAFYHALLRAPEQWELMALMRLRPRSSEGRL